MKTVEIARVRLLWDESAPGPPAPHLLRGALGAMFRDDPLFHQHAETGVVYRYPLIQYRWDWRGAVVLGLGEGAQALIRAHWPGMELRLGDRICQVRDAAIELDRHSITLTDALIRYRFAAPWLPFNQELFQRYRGLAPAGQVRERDRLAVAGLLLALRGFGVELQGRLYAAFEMRSSRPCPYGNVQLVGFRGRLLTNIDLPDGLALGRAVSHGYGWIEREMGYERGESSHERHTDARSSPASDC